MSEHKFPTEIVELPSKGLLYPLESPLSAGTVELKYMTAKEEDILTNLNYIQDFTVFDRLLKSLIVTKINYDELLTGDKDAIMIAARILGYGKDYTFTRYGSTYTCDLTQLKHKDIDESLFTNRQNEFTYELPHTGGVVTFKLLTHGDEMKIEAEKKGLLKIDPTRSYERTMTLKHTITSINGNRDKAAIRDFVDNYFLAKDSIAFRTYIRKVTPGVDMMYYPNDGQEGIKIEFNSDFFWPSAE